MYTNNTPSHIFYSNLYLLFFYSSNTWHISVITTLNSLPCIVRFELVKCKVGPLCFKVFTAVKAETVALQYPYSTGQSSGNKTTLYLSHKY